MNLFRDLGRRAERLRRQVVSSADDAECTTCGAAVRTDRDACPECGGEDLVIPD